MNANKGGGRQRINKSDYKESSNHNRASLRQILMQKYQWKETMIMFMITKKKHCDELRSLIKNKKIKYCVTSN